MIKLGFVEADDVRSALTVAGEVIAAGGVVLIPTESYYGLGADPWCHEAVERVLELKGRPAELGMPVVCGDWQQVETLVRIPDRHRVKLSRIWPAALSVVVPSRERLPSAREETLAVRIPDHDNLRVLLYRVGPLTATSANAHGEPPAVTADAALASLHGEPGLVLDGGELGGGLVSTMVDLATDEGRVIRPGAVGWEQPFDPEEWVISPS